MQLWANKIIKIVVEFFLTDIKIEEVLNSIVFFKEPLQSLFKNAKEVLFIIYIAFSIEYIFTIYHKL